ncbi:MAG TPA: hypothetical protein VF756_06135 [Thermoanaerobaculia bacterium]
MRTVLEMDDELVRAAERRAADQGVTLDELVEGVLRIVLHEEEKTSAKPFRLRWVTVKGQLPPDVDLSDRAALIDRMEGRA